MDQFKGLYYEYCKSYYIEPNETILGEIEKYEFLNEILNNFLFRTGFRMEEMERKVLIYLH
jgi:hypothetical protein